MAKIANKNSNSNNNNNTQQRTIILGYLTAMRKPHWSRFTVLLYTAEISRSRSNRSLQRK